MTDKTDSKERDLMALVDAYAEARHIGGCHTYNAKTAEARAKVVASLSANAGEPVAWQYRSLPDVGGVWFECSKERADQRAAHPERWEVRPLYAAPPTAQAEGWTKPHRTVTYVCPVCAASLERQE